MIYFRINSQLGLRMHFVYSNSESHAWLNIYMYIQENKIDWLKWKIWYNVKENWRFFSWPYWKAFCNSTYIFSLSIKRLNRNSGISKICKELAAAFTTKPSNLRELELCYNNFEDTEMEILSSTLMSTNCKLEALR